MAFHLEQDVQIEGGTLKAWNMAVMLQIYYRGRFVNRWKSFSYITNNRLWTSQLEASGAQQLHSGAHATQKAVFV